MSLLSHIHHLICITGLSFPTNITSVVGISIFRSPNAINTDDHWRKSKLEGKKPKSTPKETKPEKTKETKPEKTKETKPEKTNDTITKKTKTKSKEVKN